MNISFRQLGLLSVGLMMLIITSCSMTGGNQAVQAPLEPVSCIVVLPAGTSVDRDNKIGYEEARSLEKGAAFTTTVLHDSLADNPKVRFVDEVQLSGLVSEISGGITGTVAEVGRKLNCEAVLITEVQRFKDRQGTDYSVDSPASASVRMVLRQAEQGRVLWSADFRETQKSFFENILSYDKMQGRGFKWISVEQLVEQGVSEKLESCPYLK